MSLAGSAPLQSGGGSQGPTLAPAFEPIPATQATASKAKNANDEDALSGEDKKKHKKRSLFGFGKKKHDETLAGKPAVLTSPTAASKSHGISTLSPAGQANSHGSKAASTVTSAPKAPTASTTPANPPMTPSGPPAAALRKPTSPTQVENMSASFMSTGSGSGGHSNYGYFVLPASPGRSVAGLSSSPRVSSPAGSQIFERDVQESGSSALLGPNSPAIPSHITTEDRIPPVLDASSEAITDDHLDPDSVEIITHAHHQPALLAVTGMGGNGNSISSAVGPVASSAASGVSTGAWVDDVASSFVDKDDSASNYGSFDNTDVRRLSFISFADVVLAEHQQQQQQQQQQQYQQHLPLGSSGAGASVGPAPGSSGSSRDQMHLAGLTSLATLGSAVNRSPSPMRSPTATNTTGGLGTSPPTSKSGSVKGLELSPPSRKATMGSTYSSAMGSPTMSAVGSSTLLGGELAVETMTQALRRTGSGDLSGVRSLPQSPISPISPISPLEGTLR